MRPHRKSVLVCLTYKAVIKQLYHFYYQHKLINMDYNFNEIYGFCAILALLALIIILFACFLCRSGYTGYLTFFYNPE